MIAGKAKGRRLRVPKKKGVRPTSDYLREALFDILGPSIRGVRVLDLYAGSGAVGIEALSRGSDEVVFLEQDPACLRVLRANLQGTGLGPGQVLTGDVLRILPRLARQRGEFDIIFVDPPYGTGLARRTLEVLASGDLLPPQGIIVIEHFAKELLPERIGSLSRTRERAHGQSVLSFYGKTSEVER